jgi:hypothetical protein
VFGKDSPDRRLKIGDAFHLDTPDSRIRFMRTNRVFSVDIKDCPGATLPGKLSRDQRAQPSCRKIGDAPYAVNALLGTASCNEIIRHRCSQLLEVRRAVLA